MEPLDGDAPLTITTQSKWIICNFNCANYANGAYGNSCTINSIGDIGDS